MNVDEGILFNSAQLPVTQLNYGGSLDRFSWVLYRLGFLRCSGKEDWAEYPSEIIGNWINRTETELYIHDEAIGAIISAMLDAVYFTAHTDRSYTGYLEMVPFKNVLDEHGSGLDHSTGEITIKTGGVYHFVVSARQY